MDEIGKLFKCKLVSTYHLYKPLHSTITPRGRKVIKILLILKSINFLMIHLTLDFIVLLLSLILLLIFYLLWVCVVVRIWQFVLDYNDLMKIPVVNDRIRDANRNAIRVR
jgi:hypothetical protein